LIDSFVPFTLPLTETTMSSHQTGNLALCQNGYDSDGPECLGSLDTERPLDDSTMPRVDGGIGDEASETALNWRFEDGLLRSIGPDGYATDLCLGPSNSITTLDGSTCKPYELVLQDCPGVETSNKENIFERDDTSNNIAPTTPTTSERHMQFLVVGDGRVQSLAPVLSEGKDVIADKPFCVTIMKLQDDNHSNAYLMPCHDPNNSQGTKECLQNLLVFSWKQDFDTDAESSFEPFLSNLKSEDESMLQLAYQIGNHETTSSDKNDDQFDSFVIRVTSDVDSSLNQDPAVVFETTVSTGSDSRSGIFSYPLSSFRVAGGMEGHLIRTSRDGLESSWLASTSFVVLETSINPLTNGWTWALVVFSSFMACYVILIKSKSFFCRNTTKRKRKKKRESDLTAATLNSINVGDLDWGRASVRIPSGIDGDNESGGTTVQIPTRINGVQRPNQIDEEDQILFQINEEDLDSMDVFEDSTSTEDNTVTDGTVDTDDLDTSGDTIENEIEANQQQHQQ